MVTGDAPATAAIVARAVGLEGAVCPQGPIPEAVKPEDFAVFANILPEGKFDLVKAFQKNGSTVGMCGDGANDAPALRQAQIGIAVSTATDVAKSAGQATIYAIRSRRHLWGLRPTKWLVLSSMADILIISILAVRGVAMAPLPLSVIACEFAGALVFGLVLDSIKIPVFARLGIS